MADDPQIWMHRSPVDRTRVLGQVWPRRAEQVAAAAAAVGAVQPAWGATSLAERAARLSAWRTVLAARTAVWVEALIRDVGKPRADAEGEIRYGLSLVDAVCALIAEEPPNPADGPIVRHRPLGLVALITPWNNPFAIPVGKLAPALGFGNGVLWKPAPPASALSLLIADSLREADLADLVAVLPGDAETGRLVVEAPGVEAIAFTGSVAAGRIVIRHCHALGRLAQAELGGNNAAIVLADANLDATAAALAPAMFSYAGQRCTAIRRVIVEQPVLARFTEAFIAAVRALKVGSPEDPATEVGPVISAERQAALLDAVRVAQAAGARTLTGGSAPAQLPSEGCWVEPTVVTGLDPASPVWTEELFGPVVALAPATDLDQALALHNRVEHGLLGVLFSNDPDREARFLDRAEAGMLAINQARPAFAGAGPFVGWKASGFGPPEHGRWNRDFYSRVQAVYGAP